MTERILVTGGAGFIGSHTCKALATAGYEPVAYDNLSLGHRWAVRWGPLVVGELADGAKLRRTMQDFRIAGVLHFAASAYVGESMRAPRAYFQNNVANTLVLLDSMLDAAVPVIGFSSTCATFGEPEQLPIADGAPQRPINPYGDSKLFVERALRWYSEAYGLRSASLRYFNAAGADPSGEIGEDHDPETHLIPLIIAAARGERPHIEIFGTDYETPDGTAIRDYIHVTDLADAHVRAMAYLLAGAESAAFNLGTGRGYSIREVIAAVERISGRRVPVVAGARRPGDPPALVAGGTRAREALGWVPQFSDLPTIVETAWRWHARCDAADMAGLLASGPLLRVDAEAVSA